MGNITAPGDRTHLDAAMDLFHACSPCCEISSRAAEHYAYLLRR
jgi:hypothetical protein